jgi:hypothetical protein
VEEFTCRFPFGLRLLTFVQAECFFTDKHGHIIFFPWGTKRKAFVLDNKETKQRVANFYTGLAVAFFLIVAMFTNSKSFWLIVIALLLGSLVYLFIWFLYVRIVTANLKLSNESYTEIALEKISADSEKEEALSIEKERYRPPKHGSKPKHTSEIERIENDPFLQIKQIYYDLSAGQLFMLSFCISLVIIGAQWTFHPHVFSGEPEEYLALSLVFFFWGLGFFFMVVRAETSDFLEFIRWKLLSGILSMALWAAAIFNFYKFFIH